MYIISFKYLEHIQVYCTTKFYLIFTIMSTNQPSRIDNPEIVSKGIEFATLDPISAKAIRNTLDDEEKRRLFMRDPQVREMIASDPERKKQRLDQKEIKANIKNIKSMTSAKRAVELHNDPKYDNLYSHQQKFQDTLIANYANNSTAVEKMNSVLSDIDTIKLDVMPLKNEEQSLPVNERSVVHGWDAQQSTNDVAWADSISYGRNQAYVWLPVEGEKDENGVEKEILIDTIIDKLIGVGVSESDAIRLIVLRLWLGKYGCQGSDGGFYSVGDYGGFAYSRAGDGDVRCFYFNGSGAWRSSDWQEGARTILRN